MRINMNNSKKVFSGNFFITHLLLSLSLIVFLFLPYSNTYADTFSSTLNNIALGIADDSSSDTLDLEDIEKMENEENDTTEDSSDTEEDLEDSDSLGKISDRYNMGVNLTIGSQIVRERLGVSFIGIISEKMRYSFKISYGSWANMKIKYNNDDYEVVSKDYGTNINFFYYPKFFFPIYINVATGYYYWKGDIKPVSVLSNEEKNTPVQDPNLKSDFSLHTIMISSSIGWDFYFSNGWFIQHCLFGIGSTFTVSSKFSDNEVSDTKSSLKRKLAKPYVFGPLNIGIGKLF